MAHRTPSRSTSASRSSSPIKHGRAFDGMSGGLGNISYDTTAGGGAGDVTNPFFVKPQLKHAPSSSAMSTSPTKSRPNSRGSVDSHSGTAGIRAGMGSMDVLGVGGDWRAGTGSGSGMPLPGGKSSKGISGKSLDRFIPSRQNSEHFAPSLANGSASASNADGSTAHLSAPDLSASLSALNISASNPNASASASGSAAPHQRILSFHAAPPSSAHAHATSHLDMARRAVRSGLPTPGSAPAPGAPVPGPNKRRTPTVPDRVLDAPGFANDYYLNLLSWSVTNKVAIGLGKVGYVWDADSGDVQALHAADDDDAPDVSSLSWAGDGAYLAVGNDSGEVEIWDVEMSKKIRTMAGHRARVGTLSWNNATLSSGCRDGSIFHHDVRIAAHKVQELNGHRAEVCGLAWRGDGQFLASGGNDNVVNCWDGRVGQSVLTDEAGVGVSTPKWQKMNHTAAVKAIAWCPWQSSLLATGGGTNDQTINFWSSTTGARLSSLPTSSQVTSLVWSPHSKEILSTHGFPDNHISLWSYPTLNKIFEFPAHDERVLCSALSPDGCTVVTGACDENLKFWKIWEAKTGYKAKAAASDAGGAARSKMNPKLR